MNLWYHIAIFLPTSTFCSFIVSAKHAVKYYEMFLFLSHALVIVTNKSPAKRQSFVANCLIFPEDDPASLMGNFIVCVGVLFHSDCTPNFRSYALHKSIV